MTIQAEVSLYPLKTEDLTAPITRFVRRLEARGLQVDPGAMSTRVSGPCEALFAGLAEAFAAAADRHQVVLTARISNACPPVRSPAH